MDLEDKHKAARALHDKAIRMRGRFLNSVAVLEREIAKILTEYFCTTDESKREIFFEKIAERMSFEQKKQALIEIVQRDYPRYWDDNEETLRALSKIQEFRNKLAHSTIDTSDEALARPLDKGVGFIQWRKGEPVTDKAFQEFDVKAGMVMSTLHGIRSLLPFKEIPKDAMPDD